jgi:hypothetical protein
MNHVTSTLRWPAKTRFMITGRGRATLETLAAPTVLNARGRVISYRRRD